MRSIVIMHENEEWVVPLHAAFKARGVEATEWFLDTGVVPYDSVPDDAVYYNRMSASSHTRGHRFAPELTRMALTWLEKNNRTVVNGTPALALETCKLSQYRALEAAGLHVPATRAVVGREQLVAAAVAFDQWPLILKPNRGGKGLGVARYDSVAALEQFVGSDAYAEPLDGIWLLQAYVRPQAPYITRAEFVGRRFVYTVQVNTEDGFELCPADVCDIGDAFCPATEEPAANEYKLTLTDRYNEHDIIRKLQGFLEQAQVDVAGIEFIESENGELMVYDVNTNTNYNSGAEQRAGGERTGMGALADYLIDLASAKIE
ncbi:alpha-L-glutamate ligase [Pseudidiomarina aestuarii]|uniref:Alpha-L-glutamate ligase n=1 Tax=Pseudidiomarina aestuarii TaxID=624146 RepID=A0A2T4CX61_9GAMM|nr:alpha-L-glutamate ligase [Pseudidiomarina aestuarii]